MQAALGEDGAIDQRVSVSELPEGMIGGFKSERAFCASAIRVDLRTRGRVNSFERQGRKVSARWRRPKLMTSNRYEVSG